MQLKLFLLGPFSGSFDNKPLSAFRNSKIQALLIYLTTEAAFAAGQPRLYLREQLMTLLWPDFTLESAQANLRQVVYLMRKMIPRVESRFSDNPVPFVLSERETIQLHPEAKYTCDVMSFLTLAPRTGDPEAWLQAESLYRGDFCLDFFLTDSEPFEEWVAARRAALHRQALSLLENLAEFHLQQKKWAEAERVARQQLLLDNNWEPGHQQLMQALAGSGNRMAAVAHYEKFHAVLAQEFETKPSPETEAVLATIQNRKTIDGTLLTSGPAQIEPVQPILSNLPVQPTPFLGREQELIELGALIADPDIRLVTILGSGGMGKTRLALAVAEKLMSLSFRPEDHPYKDGIFFIRLADLISPADIASTLARVLNFQYRGGDRSPEDQLCSYLRHKQMLIILDNFEHLLDGVDLVSNILQGSQGIKFLATSREKLHLYEEHAYPIQGLAYRDQRSSVQFSVSDAVQLFELSARRARPDFRITDEQEPYVSQICHLVEGMPLALELAAGWADILAPVDIRREMQKSLDFLETEMRNFPVRHRNIRATFEVSWQRASLTQRDLFSRFSIFRGGFSREAAEVIVEASAKDLSKLVSQSLLRYIPAEDRYEMHELLRQFGAEKLEANPEIETLIRDLHSSFYCQQLTGFEAILKGPEQLEAFAEIEKELDNILTAWNRAVSNQDICLLETAIFSLGRFLGNYVSLPQGEKIFRRTIESLADTQSASGLRLLSKLLVWQADNVFGQGRHADAHQLLRTSLSILERPELDDVDTRSEKAFALFNLSKVRANVDKARENHAQALELYRQVGDLWGLASAHFDPHLFLVPKASKPTFEKGLELAQTLGDRVMIAKFKLGLSYIGTLLGDHNRSERLASESLVILRESRFKFGLVWGLEALGDCQLYAGKLSQALASYREARDLASEIGRIDSVCELTLDLSRVHRHLGEYDLAKQYGQEALDIATHVQNPNHFALARITLSCIDLVEGRFGEAMRWLKAYVDGSREDIGWTLPFALSINSTVLMATNEGVEARKQALKALKLSLEGPSEFSINVLSIAALLLAEQGKKEQAVEAYAVAQIHHLVAVSKWFDSVYGRRISQIANVIPRKVKTAANVRGIQQDFWQASAKLAKKLEEMGWGR